MKTHYEWRIFDYQRRTTIVFSLSCNKVLGIITLVNLFIVTVDILTTDYNSFF